MINATLMTNTTELDVRWDPAPFTDQSARFTATVRWDSDNCLKIERSYTRGGANTVHFFLLTPGVKYLTKLTIKVRDEVGGDGTIDYPERVVNRDLPAVYTSESSSV